MKLRELMVQLEVIDRQQQDLEVVLVTYDEDGNEEQHDLRRVQATAVPGVVFLEA